MSNAGRKLSAPNYRALTAREPWRTLSPDEERHARRAQMSRPLDEVAPFDDEHSPFFASVDISKLLDEAQMRALDQMCAERGFNVVLKSLEQLARSRIDEGLVMMGRGAYHLMREDSYSRLAESLMHLAMKPDTRDL